MEPWHCDDRATIYHGDCIEVLRGLPDASVDSVVTDPPYGLEFMGKDWDRFSPVDLDRGGRWTKDKRGTAGKLHEDTGRAHGRVAYGANRSYTSECRTCGRRDAFRNPHTCQGDPKWERVPVDEGAPPQMLAFQAWCELWTAECLRVLKPGGHLLAFGGTRTWHRLAVAVEDAGFEVRDSIAWLYGSGFPKSLDVSKAIDKAAGAEREVIGTRKLFGTARIIGGQGGATSGRAEEMYATHALRDELDITAPATPDAARWSGWGTALKPAFEPVVVARKPLTGTVAANVLEHGTGGLNIDGCRIPTGETLGRAKGGWGNAAVGADNYGNFNSIGVTVEGGRWPANVVLDEDQADALDKQAGPRPSAGKYTKSLSKPPTSMGDKEGFLGSLVSQRQNRYANDTGGASRFFYVAKAPAKERPKVDGIAHPTVKPLTLMRWLCRLVTPPGGIVLEPFAGSGTTIEAALMEGFRVVAVEREDDYLPLIAARLERVAQESDGQLTFDASA